MQHWHCLALRFLVVDSRHWLAFNLKLAIRVRLHVASGWCPQSGCQWQADHRTNNPPTGLCFVRHCDCFNLKFCSRNLNLLCAVIDPTRVKSIRWGHDSESESWSEFERHKSKCASDSASESARWWAPARSCFWTPGSEAQGVSGWHGHWQRWHWYL